MVDLYRARRVNVKSLSRNTKMGLFGNFAGALVASSLPARSPVPGPSLVATSIYGPPVGKIIELVANLRQTLRNMAAIAP